MIMLVYIAALLIFAWWILSGGPNDHHDTPGQFGT